MRKYFNVIKEKVDYDLSQKCANFGSFQKGLCYNNVFNNFYDVQFALKKDAAVVYGYVLSANEEAKLAVRHCYYEIDGKIVDPTIIMEGYSKENVQYFDYVPIAKYIDFVQYLDDIEKNNYYVSLTENFSNEKDLVKKIEKEGYNIL